MGKALLRDPLFRTAVLALAALALLYAVPGLSQSQLAFASDYLADPVMLAIALASLLVGWRGIQHWEERRFWIFLAIAFGFWLEERLFYLSWHPQARSGNFYLVTNGMYLVYYLAMVLACELRPHRPSGWSRQDPGMKWQFAGALVFTLTLFSYFVVIPRFLNIGVYESQVPSLLLYLCLDAWLIVRFLLYMVRCFDAPRWRALYGLLAAVNVMVLVGDLVECWSYIHQREFVRGTPLDLVDFVPLLLVSAAGRLRHVTKDREEPAVEGLPRSPSTAHSLFWYAMALPVVHLAGYQLGLLDDASQPTRRFLITGYIMLSGALILYYQRTLESRQHRLQADVEHMDEQLQQARRMESLGRLAGGVAHDFNNLLMVIHGYSQILREGLQDNPPLAMKAEEIQKASDRAASLTAQLLAFSRKQVLQTQIFDVNEVVGDTAKMLRRLIGENIQLLLLPSPDPARVQADPGQIGQVIVNLALNARDAMPDGGRLTIAVTPMEVDRTLARRFAGMKPGLYVRIAVNDTGMGMDDQTRSRIFEPFFTTKQHGRGTGLGLAMVYGIVQQSNGVIDVDSHPSKGTSFFIYLPLLSGTVRIAPPENGDRPPARGWETVLVVEDEAPLRHLTVEFLRGQGYRVLEAASGDAALACAREHNGQIHLLLSDVVMPGMSGVDLAKRMGAEHPETRIILMSGYIEDVASLESIPSQSSGFLQKPFGLHELATKARQVLEKERGTRN